MTAKTRMATATRLIDSNIKYPSLCPILGVIIDYALKRNTGFVKEYMVYIWGFIRKLQLYSDLRTVLELPRPDFRVVRNLQVQG